MHHCVCIVVLLLPLIVSVVDCDYIPFSPYGFVYISGTKLLLLFHVIVVPGGVVATVLVACSRSCSCSCLFSSSPTSSEGTSCTSCSSCGTWTASFFFLPIAGVTR